MNSELSPIRTYARRVSKKAGYQYKSARQPADIPHHSMCPNEGSIARAQSIERSSNFIGCATQLTISDVCILMIQCKDANQISSSAFMPYSKYKLLRNALSLAARSKSSVRESRISLDVKSANNSSPSVRPASRPSDRPASRPFFSPSSV